MPTFVVLLVLALTAALGAQQSGVRPAPVAPHANPVLPADYPDPSVIRVGRDYWATATTSQWAPIFPLLHSTDLVNWRHAGSVFQTPPSWSAGSYWAPEIVTDRGRFFIYYTARRRNGPLCVAVADAPKPLGPYTDRGPVVCQEVGSIDAAFTRDENGRPYLVWKEDGNSRKLPTPIWAQPLSEDGTKLIGDKQELLRNEAQWEAHLIEGPFIHRRGDWFYMFYSADACCGRQCNYKLGVVRSRTLLGPWERHPGNPILAANDAWKCPGHGSIVTDPAGRTFLLYHAYDAIDFEYVGRQGLLDEVTWNREGWPAINRGRGPSRAAPAGAAPRNVPRSPAPIADDFAKSILDPRWQWPWDQPEQPRVEPSRGGWLRLRTGEGPVSAAVAVAARPAPDGSYTARAMVDVTSLEPGVRAGIAAFGNRDNLLAITVQRPDVAAADRAGEPVTVTVWQTQKGQTRTRLTEWIGAGDRVYLQLNATDRTRFDFAVSTDGKQWKPVVAEADGGYLPPWDLAVRVALLVAGAPNSAARFGMFELRTSSRN